MQTLEDIAARLRSAGCVFAEDEAALLLDAATDTDALEAMVADRMSGTRLEHVVGWAEFCGLRVSVERGVFVPRPRTEPLAEAAVRLLPATGGVLVDLCCGSGAIAMVAATRRRDVEVHAADIDPAAVRCACVNLEPLGARVHEGDLFDALPAQLRGRIDVLTANVPYVPSDDVALLPREARDHEPRTTLDGGVDGLELLRRVAAGARDWLAPGGAVLSETSLGQASAAAAALEAAGLAPNVDVDDEFDVAIVCGIATSSSQFG